MIPLQDFRQFLPAACARHGDRRANRCAEPGSTDDRSVTGRQIDQLLHDGIRAVVTGFQRPVFKREDGREPDVLRIVLSVDLAEIARSPDVVRKHTPP